MVWLDAKPLRQPACHRMFKSAGLPQCTSITAISRAPPRPCPLQHGMPGPPLARAQAGVQGGACGCGSSAASAAGQHNGRVRHCQLRWLGSS